MTDTNFNIVDYHFNGKLEILSWLNASGNITEMLHEAGEMVVAAVHQYDIKIYNYKKINNDSVKMEDSHILVGFPVLDEHCRVELDLFFDVTPPPPPPPHFITLNCHIFLNKIAIYFPYNSNSINTTLPAGKTEDIYDLNITKTEYKNATDYINSIEKRNPNMPPYRISLPDKSGNYIAVLYKNPK